METPAKTVERLLWLTSIVATYGGGNLLLNLPSCEMGVVCSYNEMFDWKLGMGLLAIGFLSTTFGIQAIVSRSRNKTTWVSIFFDDRTKDEVINDALEEQEDDVSVISDGWAKMEEKHLTNRLEEE